MARSNELFAATPDAMVIVAAIGIFTAILAASIAMTQTDIKRVLAYSTLSQLGYMFAALGVGAFTAAIFHLMTHGFFKGLLFLGSGSVIHAVHEEQDMRRMGGLAKKIPITYATMLIGSIAIAGIPPLAGFFSKDEILGEAFKFGFYWVWGIGLFVALLTAFYMFRLMGLTFWGAFRGPKAVWDRIHESPRVMTVPLILLAIPSVAARHGARPAARSEHAARLAGAGVPSRRGGPGTCRTSRTRCSASTACSSSRASTVAAVGVALAWRFFGVDIGAIRLPARPEPVREISALPGAVVPVPRLAQQVVVRRAQPPAVHRHRRTDRRGDVVVRPRGRRRHGQRRRALGTVDAGKGLRRVQTGRVQNYALGIAIGLIVMAGSYLILVGGPR